MDQVGTCVHARTCGEALALEHNGDLYSCDHYVEDDYLLGNIAEGRTLLQLATSPRQTAFGQAKLDTLPQYCRQCDVREECLQYAIDSNQEYGIWGGLTEEERRYMRRELTARVSR